MPTNLQHLSLPALTDAVEFNLQELSTLWGHAIGAEFSHEPEATWFISGVPHWTYNMVTKTLFTAETPPERIDAILTRLGEYKCSMYWPVDSSSSSASLKKLEEYGWVGGGITVLARDLQTLGEMPALPEGVTVQIVETKDVLEQSMRVLLSGYDGLPAFLYDRAAEVLSHHHFVAPPGVYYYLGRLNGEPVTTALMFLGGGIASIFNTATLPSARRHGVASAVVRECLLKARAMGYHVLALQPTEMGDPVYRRLGFEEGGKVNFYYLLESANK